MLAGLGQQQVPVYRRPRVAILSTGDELVGVDETPPPGKIRDINSASLAALVEEAGGIPIPLGICGDDFQQLLDASQKALQQADVLLLSGSNLIKKITCKSKEEARRIGEDALKNGYESETLDSWHDE